MHACTFVRLCMCVSVACMCAHTFTVCACVCVCVCAGTCAEEAACPVTFSRALGLSWLRVELQASEHRNPRAAVPFPAVILKCQGAHKSPGVLLKCRSCLGGSRMSQDSASPASCQGMPWLLVQDPRSPNQASGLPILQPCLPFFSNHHLCSISEPRGLFFSFNSFFH